MHSNKQTNGLVVSACRLVLCAFLVPYTSALPTFQKKALDEGTSEKPTAPWFRSFRKLGFGLPKSSGTVPFSGQLDGEPNRDFFAAEDDEVTGGNPIDLRGIGPDRLGIAPIPVPGFPGPQDIPQIAGVNTLPGLDMFTYLIGNLIPQTVSPANQLLGGSLSRILPQQQTENLANRVFDTLSAPATNVEVDRMMGRWFQVINTPYVIREACTVAHYGALTNNSYSATFTILKFYREQNAHGSPRFSLGYGFKAGENGTFVIHNSNTPESEPYWVVKTGPLNEFNQYDYAIISNWIRFPVLVLARDPERFQNQHMRPVLQYLEDNKYINVMTKALNMISPVDYSQCQYTPTFSGAGK